MRRKLAAAVLAAGMLAAAAGCSDGSGSTEDICENLEESVTPKIEELSTAVQAAGAAAAQDDQAALAEAGIKVSGLVGQITGEVRDAADDADDNDFRDALRGFADELENMTSAVVSGENPDLAALGDAERQIESHCG